jgi:phage-related protein
MKKTVVIKPLFKGSAYELCEVVVNGRNLVKEFMVDHLTKDEQRKIIALFKYTAENGIHPSEEKFKTLRDDISEFKSFQTRVFCSIQNGRIILLLHGVKKKKNKTNKTDIQKAINLLAAAQD